jgi:FixJ family two-component response regulator
VPNRKLVFIVDDDAGTRNAVQRLLRHHGYDSVLFPTADASKNHKIFEVIDWSGGQASFLFEE